MKSLRMLALASAVSMTSAGAFAMQAMDDDSMAAATGQDGITLKIALPCYGVAADTCGPFDSHGLSINQVFVEDNDGFSALNASNVSTSYVDTGYLLIDGISVTTTSGSPIVVNIDQTGNTGNASGTAGTAASTDTPGVNVNVVVPAITIAMGATYVTNGLDDTDTDYVQTKISNAMSISTSGPTTLNIQLGGQPQGALVKVATSIAGGLTITNSGLHDGVLGGDINTASITVTNAGGTALDIQAAVNVSTNAGPFLPYAPNGGLIIKLTQLGAAGFPVVGGAGGIDVTLAGTTLGNTGLSAALGDVYIKGLNINGTRLIVYGH